MAPRSARLAAVAPQPWLPGTTLAYGCNEHYTHLPDDVLTVECMVNERRMVAEWSYPTDYCCVPGMECIAIS